MDGFFLEETWAGYKNITVEGRRIAFIYGWDEIDQEYLKHVVEKYPETFVLEAVDNSSSLLKIKDFDNLKIEILQDIVNKSNSEWFELIDLDTKKLLNTNTSSKVSENIELLNLN